VPKRKVLWADEEDVEDVEPMHMPGAGSRVWSRSAGAGAAPPLLPWAHGFSSRNFATRTPQTLTETAWQGADCNQIEAAQQKWGRPAVDGIARGNAHGQKPVAALAVAEIPTDECRVQAPPESTVKLSRGPPHKLNSVGLPLRPGQQLCDHFMRTWRCKFGIKCKLHHPDHEWVHAAVDAESVPLNAHGIKQAAVPSRWFPVVSPVGAEKNIEEGKGQAIPKASSKIGRSVLHKEPAIVPAVSSFGDMATELCSAHGKTRSLQCLMDDGEGGFQCTPKRHCFSNDSNKRQHYNRQQQQQQQQHYNRQH
jgi:hypothetical protein